MNLEYESVRLDVLSELHTHLHDAETALTRVQMELSGCTFGENQWPPQIGYITDALRKYEKIYKRYYNLIDVHRMPQDHGDAAIRRALEKVGFHYFCGGYDYVDKDFNHPSGHSEVIVRVSDGTTTELDLHYINGFKLHNLHVTCRVYVHPFTDVPERGWMLVNPTAGEVLDKLGLVLPIE